MTIIRVTIGGSLTGSQRWSVGHTMFFTAGGVATGTELNAYANALLDAFKINLFTGSGVGKIAGANATGMTLDVCKVYLKASSAAPALQVGTSSIAGGAGVSTIASAPQVAIVATLENGLAGRANRGRMYLPATSGGLVGAATFQMSASDATAWATSVANYLSAARAIPTTSGGSLVPVVSSATSANPVSAVSVDTVLDTQRRRRDKIIGTRRRQSLVVG